MCAGWWQGLCIQDQTNGRDVTGDATSPRLYGEPHKHERSARTVRGTTRAGSTMLAASRSDARHVHPRVRHDRHLPRELPPPPRGDVHGPAALGPEEGGAPVRGRRGPTRPPAAVLER